MVDMFLLGWGEEGKDGPRHRTGLRRPRAHARKGSFFLIKGAYVAILGLNGVYIAIRIKRAQAFTRLQPIS